MRKMRNSIKYILVTATLLTLSSCGIYTKFSAPVVEDTSIVGEEITLRKEPIGSLPTWREYFSDAQLQALIEVALESNADLKIAELNITQAQRSLTTARLAMVPSLTLSATGDITKLGSYTTKTYTVPATATWEIDVFGRLRNSKMQAMAAVDQTRLYESAIRSQLVASVATNYYALILADNQLSVTRESMRIMEQSLETITALMEVGTQTQAAVEQAEANLKALALTLESLEQSVKLTSNNLNLLLNRSPQQVKRSADIVDLSFSIVDNLSLAALSSRPDVLFSEAVLCQSFYGVNYARSSLYPLISVSASAGVSTGELLLNALGSITQPIFHANANRAALKNAKDQYEQDLLSFNLTLLTAGKEVNDALVNIGAAERKRILSQGQTENLSKAVAITQNLMEAGRVNYLEVLTAQNTFLSSSLEFQSVKYDEAIAKVSLYKALGGGVE